MSKVAFLRSMCAEPKDDTTREVYADWLEEQGETERAELIRVQCDLQEWHERVCGCDAYTGRCPACDGSIAKWIERERDLLRRNWYLWHPEIPHGKGGNQCANLLHEPTRTDWPIWHFVRGFCDVTLDWDTWCKFAHLLTWHPNAKWECVETVQPGLAVALHCIPDLTLSNDHAWSLRGAGDAFVRDPMETWDELTVRLLRKCWPGVREWHFLQRVQHR